MKTLLYWTIVSIALAGCSTSNRKPASEDLARSRHFIFLVHGIDGNKTHFGEMIPALENHLKKLDTKTVYLPFWIEYDTANSVKDVYLFARDMDQKIQEILRSHPRLGPNDKISIIGHSQGGLISMTWLTGIFTRQVGFSSDLSGYIDAYITLGTPFWGSKITNWTQNNLSLKAAFWTGQKQLADLAIGPNVSYQFRKFLENSETALQMKDMFKQLRVLSFGSIISSLNMLDKFAAGDGQYEDDTAVVLPSSQLNYLYFRFGKDQKVARMNFGKYYVVDALHYSMMGVSLPRIPKECVSNLECGHPTFKTMVSHILKRDDPPVEDLKDKMTSFMVQINLTTTNNLKLDPLKTLVQFDPPPHIKVADPSELTSSGIFESKSVPGSVFYHATGAILRFGKKGDTELLMMRIRYPGFQEVKSFIGVEAAKTTVIDVELEPLKN